MPQDLLILLPLLGGYWFIHLSDFTRFRAQTLSGYRLIFEAALCGFAFVPVAAALCHVVQPTAPGSWIVGTWEALFGWGAEGLGVLSLSLLLAPVFAVLFNLVAGVRQYSEWDGIWDDEAPSLADLREASLIRARERAVQRVGNHLTKLFFAAAVTSQAVNLTMRHGKVYVGWITKLPTLDPDEEYVRLLPMISGYRDRYTREVRFTTDYPYGEYDEPTSPVDGEEFQVVLPIAKILSARLFDEEVYERFFAGQAKGTP